MYCIPKWLNSKNCFQSQKRGGIHFINYNLNSSLRLIEFDLILSADIGWSQTSADKIGNTVVHSNAMMNAGYKIIKWMFPHSCDWKQVLL